jgi:uncharacterized membrane protein YvbJ
MFCQKCGAQLPQDAVFCPACGTNQQQVAAASVTALRRPQADTCFLRGLWVIAFLGAIFGAFVVFFGVVNANGAPQEASAAAIGIAMAVIPYCIARATSELGM